MKASRLVLLLAALVPAVAPGKVQTVPLGPGSAPRRVIVGSDGNV